MKHISAKTFLERRRASIERRARKFGADPEIVAKFLKLIGSNFSFCFPNDRRLRTHGVICNCTMLGQSKAYDLIVLTVWSCRSYITITRIESIITKTLHEVKREKAGY